MKMAPDDEDLSDPNGETRPVPSEDKEEQPGSGPFVKNVHNDPKYSRLVTASDSAKTFVDSRDREPHGKTGHRSFMEVPEAREQVVDHIVGKPMPHEVAGPSGGIRVPSRANTSGFDLGLAHLSFNEPMTGSMGRQPSYYTGFKHRHPNYFKPWGESSNKPVILLPSYIRPENRTGGLLFFGYNVSDGVGDVMLGMPRSRNYPVEDLMMEHAVRQFEDLLHTGELLDQGTLDGNLAMYSAKRVERDVAMPGYTIQEMLQDYLTLLGISEEDVSEFANDLKLAMHLEVPALLIEPAFDRYNSLADPPVSEDSTLLSPHHQVDTSVAYLTLLGVPREEALAASELIDRERRFIDVFVDRPFYIMDCLGELRAGTADYLLEKQASVDGYREGTFAPWQQRGPLSEQTLRANESLVLPEAAYRQGWAYHKETGPGWRGMGPKTTWPATTPLSHGTSLILRGHGCLDTGIDSDGRID